jgi:hypothetical protein
MLSVNCKMKDIGTSSHPHIRTRPFGSGISAHSSRPIPSGKGRNYILFLISGMLSKPSFLAFLSAACADALAAARGRRNNETSSHRHIRTSAHPHIGTSAHWHPPLRVGQASAHRHIRTRPFGSGRHPHIRISAHYFLE